MFISYYSFYHLCIIVAKFSMPKVRIPSMLYRLCHIHLLLPSCWFWLLLLLLHTHHALLPSNTYRGHKNQSWKPPCRKGVTCSNPKLPRCCCTRRTHALRLLGKMCASAHAKWERQDDIPNGLRPLVYTKSVNPKKPPKTLKNPKDEDLGPSRRTIQ